MRAPLLTFTGLALVLGGAVPAVAGEAPAFPRICITEPAGYYRDSPDLIRRRLASYRELGAEALRVESGWESGALPAELLRTDFRVKLILYVLGMPPDYSAEHPGEAMVDEHGVADWHLGPWHAGLAEVTAAESERQLAQLRELGVLERIDEVVADLGPAGEGIYPANWTLGREGEEAFWCYSDAAQAGFRRAMAERHGTLEAAAEAWGLPREVRPADWAGLRIPSPGTVWARGRFWDDVLTWYRDAKRRMLEARIDETLRLTRAYLGERARVIVYLPGYAYSQREWDEAVATAGGAPSIRLMMDNDWLMETALRKGCILQYTGCENATEVARITRKLKALGVPDAGILWGENAGVESAGRDPMWLTQVICAFGMRGLDYTWSSWLFEDDHVTPSATYPQFAEAVRAIRRFRETGEQPPHVAAGGTMRETAPGTYELTPSADTRLMGSFPDEPKGSDPEIAMVEGGQTQRILMRFPLELLPADCEVTSAVLTLRSYLDYGDATTVEAGVFRVTRPWQGRAVTWRTATPADAWGRPGGDAMGRDETPFTGPGGAATPYATARLGPLTPGDALTWDVTDLVREWYAGQQPNHGLLLALDTPADANKSVAAMEHPDPAMRPRLTVTLRQR